MATATISILTPSYGYARYLGDAIDSVLSQALPGVEHVIVDGASTDGTVELLESYDGEVVWVSEPDDGQSDALNRALTLSSAPLVGWLNADEFYLPGALAVVHATFRDPHVDVVYGDAVFVDEQAGLLRLVPQHRFDRTTLRRYGPFIQSCSVFFRREALGSAPWDVTSHRLMDWELYLRLADEGKRFAYVPAPLAAFRVHDERVTAAPMDPLDPERMRCHARYGLARSRLGMRLAFDAGRVLHALLKLQAGSYRRQRAAATRTGADLRWWPPHPTSPGLLGLLSPAQRVTAAPE